GQELSRQIARHILFQAIDIFGDPETRKRVKKLYRHGNFESEFAERIERLSWAHIRNQKLHRLTKSIHELVSESLIENTQHSVRLTEYGDESWAALYLSHYLNIG